MSLIIGIVGENGGGKDSLAEAIRSCRPDLSIDVFKSSDILRDTLRMWGIEPTREHLQALPVAMENTYGKGVLSRAVSKLMHASAAQVVIYNGVRWATDVEMIRSFDHHLLVYVTAESELRFQRLRARNEKPGEEGMSYEQFLQEEQAATEREIPKIGATADVRLENNGTKDAFVGQVKSFCDQFLATDKF